MIKELAKTENLWKIAGFFLWKIYFAVYLLSFPFVFINEYKNIFKWTFMDWLGWISFFPFLLGLFLYSFKKNLLSDKFWQIFFWFSIVTSTYELLLMYTPIKDILKIPAFLLSYQPYNENFGLFGLIFFGFLSISLFAFYQLGYKKKPE